MLKIGGLLTILVLAAFFLFASDRRNSAVAEISLGDSDPTTQPVEKITKPDTEWKKILTPDQYYILREKGTEPAFHNEFWDFHQKGLFRCAGCGLELFDSNTKFDSGTGWPSFYTQVSNHVVTSKDADGNRDELLCARCGGHLGHVFDDGPKPTGLRYCIDSGALKFAASK